MQNTPNHKIAIIILEIILLSFLRVVELTLTPYQLVISLLYSNNYQVSDDYNFVASKFRVHFLMTIIGMQLINTIFVASRSDNNGFVL